MSQTTDGRVTQALITALNDGGPPVRIMAAAALSQAADLNAPQTPRYTAFTVSGEAWKALADGLAARGRYLRATAAASPLPPTDPRAITALITTLKDKESYMRIMAAAALSQPADARTVEALISALQDRDPKVKEQAAKSLGHVADPRVTDALIAALQDREVLVRARAAQSLEGVKEPKAVEALVAALQDQSRAVRVSAGLSLGRLDDPGTIEGIVRTLADLDYSGVWRGSGGLDAGYLAQQLIRPAAVEPLISMLDDRHSSNLVAIIAAAALGEIGDRRATMPLARALSRDTYPPGLAFLRMGEDKYKDWERADWAAAGALGKIRDPDAVEQLMVWLKKGDTPMKYLAAEALSNIADRRATGALVAAVQVNDARLQVEAARGLRKITGQEFTGFEPDRWKQWWDQHKTEYE